MLGLHFLRFVSLLLVLFSFGLLLSAADIFNATLESTASQIVWSPALCNASLNDTNCSSAWRLADDVPGMQVTSTNGPDPLTGNIIPQMFLSFRGSAIYIRTSPLSNAMANISIYSSSQAIRTMRFNSSIGVSSALGLPEDSIVSLAVTYVPDSGRLDIQSITISVTNTSATSSYLPPISLPTSSVPPIFSSAPTQRAHKHNSTIIAESLGPAIGVILLVCTGIGVIHWRRKRRRNRMAASAIEWRLMGTIVSGGVGGGAEERTTGGMKLSF